MTKIRTTITDEVLDVGDTELLDLERMGLVKERVADDAGEATAPAPRRPRKPSKRAPRRSRSAAATTTSTPDGAPADTDTTAQAPAPNKES